MVNTKRKQENGEGKGNDKREKRGKKGYPCNKHAPKGANNTL